MPLGCADSRRLLQLDTLVPDVATAFASYRQTPEGILAILSKKRRHTHSCPSLSSYSLLNWVANDHTTLKLTDQAQKGGLVEIAQWIAHLSCKCKNPSFLTLG